MADPFDAPPDPWSEVPPVPAAPHEEEGEGAKRVHDAGGGASASGEGSGVGDTPSAAASFSDRSPAEGLLPPALRARKACEEAAVVAREAGLPVPVVPSDTAPEVRLKERLARAHLRLSDDGDKHEAALRVLSDVAEGKVTTHGITRKGEVVEFPVEAKTRVSAARALLDHAAKVSKGTGTHIEHANIVSVGDLITNVDPARLRAAVERLRSAAPAPVVTVEAPTGGE